MKGALLLTFQSVPVSHLASGCPMLLILRPPRPLVPLLPLLPLPGPQQPLIDPCLAYPVLTSFTRLSLELSGVSVGGNFLLTSFLNVMRAWLQVIVTGDLVCSTLMADLIGYKKSTFIFCASILSFISSQYTVLLSFLSMMVKVYVSFFSNSSHHMWGFFLLNSGAT